MVQQHLVLWYTSPEDRATYYEADWRTAYTLLNSGKTIKYTEEQFGEVAGGVVLNLLLLGHARVEDLVKAYDIVDKPSETTQAGPHVNGNKSERTSLNKKGHATSTRVDAILATLLEQGLVSEVNKSHLRPVADNRAEAEQELQQRPDFQGRLNGKKKIEFENAIQEKLAEWRDSTGEGIRENSKRQREKSDSDIESTAKRVRLNHGPINNGSRAFYGQINGELQRLNNHLVLRVNHEKFVVTARNQKLVSLAEDQIGTTTSQIYGQVLQILEKDMKRCENESTLTNMYDGKDVEDLPMVTTREIVASLHDTLEQPASIGNVDQSMININLLIHPKKRRRKIERDEAEVEGDASSDEIEEDRDALNGGVVSGIDEEIDDKDGNEEYANGKPNGASYTTTRPRNKLPFNKSPLTPVQQHLFLLAEHPYSFLHYIRAKPDKSESWAVDFPALACHLRQIELEKILLARYGTAALRIVRILYQKGKLEEKVLTKTALLNQKAMRHDLATMHKAGHLELQEIPRDNNRQPARTMFFWFFDHERCRWKVLDETYQAMSRCLQRLRVEREKVSVVVEKAARTDVAGREDEYLSGDERKMLQEWREREERMLGLLGRLNDLVATLRDF